MEYVQDYLILRTLRPFSILLLFLSLVHLNVGRKKISELVISHGFEKYIVQDRSNLVQTLLGKEKPRLQGRIYLGMYTSVSGNKGTALELALETGRLFHHTRTPVVPIHIFYNKSTSII